MSYRRRKSRIGPSFQAIIPPIQGEKEQKESLKLYDYQQSLSAHCLTLSDLSNPIIQSKETQSFIISHSNLHPFGVNDSSIDHKVDSKVLELTKSHKPKNFNYAQYVQQYQLYKQEAMESKLQKFQTNKSKKIKSRKRKQTNNENNESPKKKQRTNGGNVPMQIPFIPLIDHSKKQLLTPPPIPMIFPMNVSTKKQKKKKSKSTKKKKRHKKKKQQNDNKKTATPTAQATPIPMSMPPPPQFLPFQGQPPTQQQPQQASASQPPPAMYPPPPPPIPAPYGYGMYHHPLNAMGGPPHISYTHYNPQFYYMHTTYNYAPPQSTRPPQQQKVTTQRLNPELIKKQRIDNKSCEVIDLCDEKKNILSNVMNVSSAQSVAQSESNSSLTTPTNLSMDDDNEKESESNKFQKINIKSKHCKLFNSLLTPKNSTNSANNSSVIHRMQMMEKEKEKMKKCQNVNSNMPSLEIDENRQKMNDLFVKMANDLRPVNVEKMDNLTSCFQIDFDDDQSENESDDENDKKRKKKKSKKHKKKKKKKQRKKKKMDESENEQKEESESEHLNEGQNENKNKNKNKNEVAAEYNVNSAQSAPILMANNNLFGSFNVSPPNPSSFGMDNSYNMNRSASPPFNLGDDDLYLADSLPFRSPEFAQSAFYENNSPIMPSSYS